jgi:hypothetical protein
MTKKRNKKNLTKNYQTNPHQKTPKKNKTPTPLETQTLV